MADLEIQDHTCISREVAQLSNGYIWSPLTSQSSLELSLPFQMPSVTWKKPNSKHGHFPAHIDPPQAVGEQTVNTLELSFQVHLGAQIRGFKELWTWPLNHLPCGSGMAEPGVLWGLLGVPSRPLCVLFSMVGEWQLIGNFPSAFLAEIHLSFRWVVNTFH